MSALYYCRQTTTACKGIPYPSKTHPYRYGTSGCVYTSGCGMCVSLMALRNSTTRVFNTRQWTHRCLGMGARAAEGTDMAVVIYGIIDVNSITLSFVKFRNDSIFNAFFTASSE